MLISIIIKCLNEEQRIANAISSALTAIEGLDGEVIVADSCSSDNTIAIAREFPIRIVQLANPNERCCGIGPQLGYQVSQGEFVYVLDGDMELSPAFIHAALEAMRNDSSLAGVAGQIDEQSEASYQFRGRKRREARNKGRSAQWLDMGGLYRREAVEACGYLSNRNLHAYEEMELGLRLSAAGWKLQRLDIISVKHYGWDEQSFALLKRRWNSRYIDGPGEILRAAVGSPWFTAVAKAQKHVFAGLGIWALLAAALLALTYTAVPLLFTLLLLAGLVGVRAIRAGSIKDALFGQLVWQVTALASLRGFFAPRVSPQAEVAFKEIPAKS